MTKKVTNKNVMELLVEEEIDYQLKHRKMPLDLFNLKLNLVEVATFALNRLPPLYASSAEGIERQRRRGKKEYKQKIEQAVSQGFAAVARDPLRKSTPIPLEQQDALQDLQENIYRLSSIIPQEELSWIVTFMESFLQRVQEQQITKEEVVKLYYVLYYYWQDNY